MKSHRTVKMGCGLFYSYQMYINYLAFIFPIQTPVHVASSGGGDGTSLLSYFFAVSFPC